MVQATRKCSIDGCDRKHKAHGLCPRHYDINKHKGLLPNQRRCSIESCGKPAVGKGFCHKHYERLKAHGDPLYESPLVKSRRMTEEERFWKFVDIGAPNECWPWTGAKFADGYGAFTLKRDTPRTTKSRGRRAHRFSLEISLGRPIRDELFACHTCDNPICVNPAHLYEGTPWENIRDARVRNRLLRGEKVGTDRRKLTEEEVVQMRERRNIGWTLRALADTYGVGVTTVGRIVTGEAWEHAPGPITPKRTRYGDRIVVSGRRIRPTPLKKAA